MTPTTIPLTKAIELLYAATAVTVGKHPPGVPAIYDRNNPEDDEETFMEVRCDSDAGHFYFLFDDNQTVVLQGNIMHLIERESGNVVEVRLLTPMSLEPQPPAGTEPKPRAVLAHTTEGSYLHEFWWMQAIMGEIAGLLLVNAHQHNHVGPGDVEKKLEQLEARIPQFRERYAKQWRLIDFNIQR